MKVILGERDGIALLSALAVINGVSSPLLYTNIYRRVNEYNEQRASLAVHKKINRYEGQLS